MNRTFGNVYEDEERARAYAKLQFPGTYYLAFRDLPAFIRRYNHGPTNGSSLILVMPQKQPGPRGIRDVEASPVKQPSSRLHSRCVGQVVQHCFKFFPTLHSASSKQTQN
jgi:hypothetical protein